MQRDPDEISREDRIRLTHMLEAAQHATQYCLIHDVEKLRADHMRLLAVVKSIEILGEAATKVSDAMQSRLPMIDWQGIRRMRNRLIHGYDSIDVVLVWNAVENDIPPLIAALKTALETRPNT
ncbi:MAG TPA: HepT-like ribonuclease domain-containing protein [Phycisphaerales bacterium]|nr:HepT-like ribonuclease domain-containing protein [Phycisphaerales bacterium]